MSTTDIGFRRYQQNANSLPTCPCLTDIEFHQTENDDVIFLVCSGGAMGDLFLCPEAYIQHMEQGGDAGGPCEACSYCQNCPAMLTECDVEARECTQCHWPIDKINPVYAMEGCETLCLTYGPNRTR